MKIGIICANGIGDALLMQIAANHLRNLDHKTVTFSYHLSQLAPWFPEFAFSSQQEFASFDALLLQHDNTPKARAVREMDLPVYVFYGAHRVSKHGPLRPGFDAVFDRGQCMATNIAHASAQLFPGPFSLDNGLVPPAHLIHRRYPKRIAIHPTSTAPEKNWPKASFLRLRDRLAEMGWDPQFITAPSERAEWDSPLFPTLSDLAAFLYESGCLIGNDSGPGHLASNVGIPTLILGGSQKHLDFWRPGWHPGNIVVPPFWAYFIKNKIMKTISINRAIKHFTKIDLN